MNKILKIINEEIQKIIGGKKLYYHGRTHDGHYKGNYIFITDNLGYATIYSDGNQIYTYTIPFGDDKLFSLKNPKHQRLLLKYIDDYVLRAIMRDSGPNQEMDWAAMSYISTDDYEMPEDLFQHLGFLGIKLKERHDITSIYVFDEKNLTFEGIIDITDPIVRQEMTKYHLPDYIYETEKNIMEGINVWHGSDRKFDTFDMQKVGSGDGKSLGGWGIYFSDSPEVSQRYYTKNGFVREHEIKNGKYFDLDETLTDGDNIIRQLENNGVDEQQIDEFRQDYQEQADNYGDVTNKQAYDWLSYVLGGEKQASLFLKSIGYIGNTMMDKWETQARNYVVFDTSAILN